MLHYLHRRGYGLGPGMDNDDLEVLASHMELLVVEKGDTLLHTGVVGEAIMFVLDGTLAACVEGKLKNSMQTISTPLAMSTVPICAVTMF